MRYILEVGFYDYIETTAQTEGTGESKDRYDRHRDAKYKAFINRHRFDYSEKYFDLYLRLCAEGLL